MYLKLCICILSILGLGSCDPTQNVAAKKNIYKEAILKIEMNLSAFGVESDDFPSIDAYIDFRNDSSHCNKSYYNPAYKDSTYYLTKNEIKKVLTLLQSSDLEKTKKEYTIGPTDQPTSITTIYTSTKKIIVKDYGLQGEYPLSEIYKLVYKF